MAIRYKIEKHAWAYPSNVLANFGGKHIYNIELTTDCDNGNLVKKGACKELDLYAEDAATTFTGVILPFMAPNGNFYVEITDPGDALFVYQVPVINEEFTTRWQHESNFFNEAGDTVRAYELAVGDIVEVSAEGFDGDPAVNAKVTGVSNKKMKIGA